MPDQEKLYLIDAIGPFFRGYNRKTINWSKAPFEHLHPAKPDREQQWAGIRQELDVFCAKAATMGFNAVSLDDVTHLADDPHYELDTRTLISQWQVEFRRCFEVVAKHGLKIYLTMDVFSSTPSVREHLQKSRISVNAFLASLLDRFLADFPEVAGVIIRIGEADGRDVNDHFRSELHLRQPSEANRLLHALLPVFGKHQKKLVFRTWTVGAYRIGDLMWHRGTFAQVFQGLQDHPSLIVSMKYGDSDFFRFLTLNENFFDHKVAKIVELQTRREYEGCGEYPSFTGWEYERYARELAKARNVIGIMVWCQTGGWVPFRRLALLDETAVWTELNTFVTIKLFRDQKLVEDAVQEFADLRHCPDAHALIELLRLSDEVIRELLYVEDFARHTLFFRRVRVPPILQVYWNNIFISHSVKKVLSHFVQDKAASIRAAYLALDNLERMKALAAQCGMPVEDIEYMQDTFHLLALAREYYLLPFSTDIEAKLRTAKKAYKGRYPKSGTRARYRIKMNFSPFWLRYRHLGWALAVLMRRKSGYRWVDRIFTMHGLSMIYRVVARRRPQWIPSFAKESAMGVDTVFK